VRVADLIEAEGRVLRRVTARLGLSLIAVFAGGVLALIGLGLLLLALYAGIEPAIGPPFAALVTGLVCLLIALGVLWGAKSLSR
jgi:hypothetical protein